MLGFSSLSPETFARLERGFAGEDCKGQDKSWRSSSLLEVVSGGSWGKIQVIGKKAHTGSKSQQGCAAFPEALIFPATQSSWHLEWTGHHDLHAFACQASTAHGIRTWWNEARRLEQTFLLALLRLRRSRLLSTAVGTSLSLRRENTRRHLPTQSRGRMVIRLVGQMTREMKKVQEEAKSKWLRSNCSQSG